MLDVITREHWEREVDCIARWYQQVPADQRRWLPQSPYALLASWEQKATEARKIVGPSKQERAEKANKQRNAMIEDIKRSLIKIAMAIDDLPDDQPIPKKVNAFCTNCGRALHLDIPDDEEAEWITRFESMVCCKHCSELRHLSEQVECKLDSLMRYYVGSTHLSEPPKQLTESCTFLLRNGLEIYQYLRRRLNPETQRSDIDIAQLTQSIMRGHTDLNSTLRAIRKAFARADNTHHDYANKHTQPNRLAT